MPLKRIALTAALLAPLALVASGVAADEDHDHEHHQEHRRHGTHVHGIATLNLALQGEEVQLELNSPAANILGFEHAPSSEADHETLDKAVAALKNADRLFHFNKEAACGMEKAMLTSALLEEEHEGHAHAEVGKHDHDEHKDENHSDIEALYHFECARPGKLLQLSVALFEAFPATQALKVQFVTENKQGAVELSAKDHVVHF